MYEEKTLDLLLVVLRSKYMPSLLLKTFTLTYLKYLVCSLFTWSKNYLIPTFNKVNQGLCNSYWCNSPTACRSMPINRVSDDELICTVDWLGFQWYWLRKCSPFCQKKWRSQSQKAILQCFHRLWTKKIRSQLQKPTNRWWTRGWWYDWWLEPIWLKLPSKFNKTLESFWCKLPS